MADHTMRLLIVGIDWPPETFIARLIHGLLSQGIEVTVAADQRPASDWFDHPGFTWLFTPRWHGSPLKRMLKVSQLLARAALQNPEDIRQFAKKPYFQNWHHYLPFAGCPWDIIYFPWNSAAINYISLFAYSRPVVISCRGSQINIAPHDTRRQHLIHGLSHTLAKATAVHCVSNAIRHEARQYGLDPQKATIIHPAVDPEFFCPGDTKDSDNNGLCLITTGSLVWNKGYEYLLLAFRLIVDKGIPATLEIIGEGPDRQRVVYTIYDLELSDNVELVGKLAPSEVRNRLQQADIFLLSSLSEGISNAVLEAMACGLPVITTDCGGMREAVTDGEEGIVVPTADPAAMANAVEKMWLQPTLRRQMGTAGRQKILNKFTLKQQAGQFYDLFQATWRKSQPQTG